jgi:hypothetical protein
MRISSLIALLALTFSVSAAEQKATTAGKPAAGQPSATDHSFEDTLVQGKYHFSDEAVTTVEEDKVLDALIGVRTDFKDRLEQSAERY